MYSVESVFTSVPLEWVNSDGLWCRRCGRKPSVVGGIPGGIHTRPEVTGECATLDLEGWLFDLVPDEERQSGDRSLGSGLLLCPRHKRGIQIDGRIEDHPMWG